jgi:tetratricopeptide (TPR) repeat protein
MKVDVTERAGACPKTSGIAALALVVIASVAAGCSNPDVQKRRHFERGNRYAAEHKDEFAVIEYGSAVRLDPQFGEARYKLAQTYERMNNLRDAYAEYIRAADAWPDNREAQLKATQLLLLVGRFDDGKARAGALLAKNPKDVDALLLRANAMAALKDPAGAIAEIEEAMKASPNDSRTFVSLGAVRMRSGEAKDAEAAFRNAIALDRSSADAHLALANYLWTAGRMEEAEHAIADALTLAPDHLLANRMQADLYARTGRADQAEAPLKKVADISKAPAARLQLADYYLGLNRMDDARRLLEELAAAEPAIGEARLRLASIDYATNHKEKAHQTVDRMLASAPQYSPALILKAQWLTAENKLDEALARATAAVAADAESVPAHMAIAVIHEQRRETSDAIKSYNEVLRLNPRVTAAQIALSRLNLEAGNRDAALSLAEAATQTEPANIAASMALARGLLAQGDVARAEKELSALEARLPDSAVVKTLLGLLQARRNNSQAARKLYERALTLDPKSTEALAGLVTLDIRARDVDAAVARVDAALARDPQRPELLVLAAQTYALAGQASRTEQALRRAVALDPGFLQAYGLLARYYLQQHRLDDAKAELESVLKRDPAAAGPRTMVGVILETQGKREDARRWYESTLATIDNVPVVANNLAMIYADAETNLDKALEFARTAKRGLPNSPEVDDTLGWVYYKKNLPSLAIGPLRESVNQRPDQPEVLYHLGLTYAKLGDKAKAKQTLQRALDLNPRFAGSESARQTLASVR